MLITLFPIIYNIQSNEYRVKKHFKIEIKMHKKRKEQLNETIAFIIGNRFKNSQSLLNAPEIDEDDF